MKKERFFLLILSIATLLLAACGSNPITPTQATSEVTKPSFNSEEATQPMLELPFGLKWGMSLEECASIFQNDWKEEEHGEEVENQTVYVLNQKQTLYGREGTVRLNFADRPEGVSDTVPGNLLTLPDKFLTGVMVLFETSAEEIKAELVKQFGEPIGDNQVGTNMLISFSSPEVQAKNITNENQKKAYHLYRYVIMQQYRDLEEYIQTPQEELSTYDELYKTNPDELWNQIKDWNFNDGDHYLSSVTLMSSTENSSGCAIQYNIGDFLYLLNVQ